MHHGRGPLVSGKNTVDSGECRKSESPGSNESNFGSNIPSASAGVAKGEETEYTAMDGDMRHGFQRHSSVAFKFGLKRERVPRFGVQFRIRSQLPAEQLDERLEGGQSPELVACFDTAPRVPPITKEILGELDIPRIINNATLRHDINFEHELHFQPKVEGPERWSNRGAAKEYWCALEAELELYTVLWTHRDSCDKPHLLPSIIGENRGRLSVMLATIREILVTLVPDDDQSQIEEVLDVDLIMQQIAKGIYNITGLAEWLARTLKAHCAPIRDQWVDNMVRQISFGAEQSDSVVMVDGLRELFGILEAMKLDVANHQIRYLRGLLVEDTIHFEHTYFARKIADRQIDTDSARLWYLRNSSRIPQGTLNLQDGISRFVWALVRELLDSEISRSWPSTFRFDIHRLRMLHIEVQDFISVEFCCKVLDRWHRRLGRGHVSENVKHTLRDSITAILGEGPDRWEIAIPNLSSEIARIALSHRACTWSKFCNFAYSIQTELSMHCVLATQRSSNHLNGRRREMGAALFQSVHHLVKKHIHSSPSAMLNALVKPNMGGDPAYYSAPARFDDISRRVAHIACLHWNVWGPIVYEEVLTHEDADEDSSSGRSRSGSQSTGCSRVSTVEEETESGPFGTESSDSTKSI